MECNFTAVKRSKRYFWFYLNYNINTSGYVVIGTYFHDSWMSVVQYGFQGTEKSELASIGLRPACRLSKPARKPDSDIKKSIYRKFPFCTASWTSVGRVEKENWLNKCIFSKRKRWARLCKWYSESHLTSLLLLSCVGHRDRV